MLVMTNRRQPLGGMLPPDAPECAAYGGRQIPMGTERGAYAGRGDLPATPGEAEPAVARGMGGLPLVSLVNAHRPGIRQYDVEAVPCPAIFGGQYRMIRATPRGAK
jgi:hypothetical protein